MSLWSRLWPFGRKSDGPLTTSEAIWLALYGGQPSKAGVRVNHATALQVMAVLACVRVIAEGIAQLPLKVHRRTDAGSDLLPDHDLALLLRRPNQWQTSFEWREMMTMHAVMAGNAFSFINRIGGVPRELFPLVPSRVTVKQDAEGRIEYEVKPEDSSQGPIRVGPANMFHLRGPTWAGAQALDIVRLAREAIGLALATEEHVAKLHANGTRTSGVLSTDLPLSDQAVGNIKESWNKQFAGSENAYSTVILHSGLKWTTMAMSGADAETLAERRFQIEEICRAFRVNPLMVMQADKTATYASAEQFFIAHVTHTLGPWVERWEESLDRQLILEPDVRSGVYTKLNVKGLLRGDAVSRANFYSRGILDGWLTRNEVRELEELNSIPGLDLPLAPLNMADGTKPPAPPEPKPAPGSADKEPAKKRRVRLKRADDGSFDVQTEE